MPRRRYEWWGAVRTALYDYPKTRDKAITKALWTMAQTPEGVEANILLRLVYFRKTNTANGAAALIGMSAKTAERRITYAFYKVAEEMGYLSPNGE